MPPILSPSGTMWARKNEGDMMQLRNSHLVLGMALLVLTSAALAQGSLTLEVYTGRGATGYDVNSALVSGEKDMLLIDAQFSLSEAHKLAAKILESKKNLATIYITH